MERSKLVAIIAGAISLILAIAYLLIVQLLDLRGEMIPAPQSQLVPQHVLSFNFADFPYPTPPFGVFQVQDIF